MEMEKSVDLTKSGTGDSLTKFVFPAKFQDIKFII
jgi:hypothetical protein